MTTRYRRLKGLDEFPSTRRIQPTARRAKKYSYAIICIALVFVTVVLFNFDTLLNAGNRAKPMPVSGHGWTSPKFDRASKTSTFLVVSGEQNAVVRLFDQNDVELISVILRARDRQQFLVPGGSYIIRVGTGKTWYGRENLFGRAMTYQRAIGMIDVQSGGHHILDISESKGNLVMLDEHSR